MRTRLLPLAVGALAAVGLLATPAGAVADDPVLQARAVLPALTSTDGPVSGTALGPGPINGVPVPFAGRRPGAPDDTEVVQIRLARPLPVGRR